MQAISEDRQILVNLEINNQCHLTNVCGKSCVLNEIAWALPQASEQSPEQVLAAAQEVIDNGHKVRHLAIVGKEPLETPDLLFDILRYYHDAPVKTRPARVGVITSGINLKRCQQRFVELPVDWCAVSLDAGNELHVERQNEKLLQQLLSLKEAGGTEMALVNSVFTEDNHDDVVALGRSICSSGIDQWGIAPLLASRQRRLVPAVSLDSIKVLLKRVVEEIGTARAQTLFQLELSQYEEITGSTVANRWRVEDQVEDSNVFMMAANFQPGYFVRLRWDGELLNKQDFRTLGLKRGSFGSYQPGALASIIT